MRVLYFTERDTPHDRRFLQALSGTQYQIFALRQMACRPETPHNVMALDWPEGIPDWAGWNGWQSGVRQIKDLLAQVQPDLVHAGPVQGPALITALAGFHPLVTMSWGSDLLLRAARSPWMRHATRFALEHTDIFLGDCQAVADRAVRFGMDATRIEIFPWGVDLDHFSPSKAQQAGKTWRRALGWEDEFVVLCNRTWAPLYGVDLLARAFVKAARQAPKLRLLLAGDGPQADQIHGILSPVKERVDFLGWLAREDLPVVYGAADLYVSPSHCDGSSISLLEALACGCPALVSDIPANREWVVPGEVGALFKDREVESLISQMITMVSDTNLTAYGRRARALAETRANWDQNFQQCLAAYHRVIR